MTSSYPTAGLETGVQRGFTWIRLKGDNGKVFMFVVPPGKPFPSEITFGNGHYRENKGFNPFDDTLPEHDAQLRDDHAMGEMDLQKWMDDLVPRPEGCEITSWIDTYSDCVRISARTWKNGRVETVTRRTNSKLDIVPQIREIYGYFERNCPAPTPDQEQAIIISSVGQAVLNACKKQGLDMFLAWHEENEKKDDQTAYGYPSITIDGTLFSAKGITKATFERKAGLRQLLLKMEMKDGHTYDEDQKGATLTLRLPPNETLLKGAKGKRLSDILGIPGAEECTIRTAREDRDETSPGRYSNHRMVFRSSLGNNRLNIPEPEEDTLEEVYRDLDMLIGPDGHFTSADGSVAYHLDRMDPRVQREVLAILKSGETLSLGKYGVPDIRAKPSGSHICHEWCDRVLLTKRGMQT